MLAFLVIGIYTAHLISKSQSWFGSMQLAQVPTDLIIFTFLVMVPNALLNNRIPNRLFTIAQYLYFACLPAIITHVVVVSSSPFYGIYSIILFGTIIPLILTIRATTNTTHAKLMILTMVTIGQRITLPYRIFYTFYWFMLSVTTYGDQNRHPNFDGSLGLWCLSCIVHSLLPNYQRPSDISMINSLYSYNSTYTLLESRHSLTGKISVIEDSSIEGGIRLMKCDHSILGGIYLADGKEWCDGG